MSETLEHEGHRVRLRERFLAGEAGSRSDEALLELLLTYAIPQRDVQPLAKTLIDHFGSLDKVLTADPDALCKIDGTGPTTAALLKVVDLLRQNSSGAVAETKLSDHNAPSADQAPTPTPTGPGHLEGGGATQGSILSFELEVEVIFLGTVADEQ